MMFSAVVNTFLLLLPGETKKTIKDLLDIITGLLQKDWFVELLSYLLNTFKDGRPTRKQLSDALEYFANKIRLSEEAPRIFES